MSVKGQTHAKRAREFALKERRDRKKAKKAQRAEGNLRAADGTVGAPIPPPHPEAAAEWLQ